MPALSRSPTSAARHVSSLRLCLIRDPPQYRPTAIPRLLRPFSWSSKSSPLAGTVGHHDAYVLLHTHVPPSEYPARSKSPLWRALTLKARRWGGSVNFAWSPEQAVHPAYTGVGEERHHHGGNDEAYTASVFSTARRGRLHVPEVTLANIDAIDARIHAHCQQNAGVDVETETEALEAGKLFLYVCTHGSRDCRCGDAGGAVARALRAEVAKRDIASDVFLGEVAHVGGHKYAANVLVYPYGDWLGNVNEADVPRVLDEILAWHVSHRNADAAAPLCPPLWRGRMGLDKEHQIALASRPI